jgi:pseudouridine kinase
MVYGVTCIGGAVLDRKLHLHAAPVPGTSNPARMVVADGGVARNVAETLARLGVEVALVSRVGDDEAGRTMLARLAAAKVETSGVVAVPGDHTAEYVAVLHGHDLVVGAAAMDVLDDIGVDVVDRCWPPDDAGGWAFLDCNCSAATLDRAVARARCGGVRLAVDAVSTRKAVRLPADLSGVSALFCNRDEAAAWLSRHGGDPNGGDPNGGDPNGGDPNGGDPNSGDPNSDGRKLAVRLRAAGAAGVVLTRGTAGLVVADAEDVREVPAVPVAPVDVTGAGDALVGGTLAALLAGQELAEAATFGALAAALTLESEHTVRPDLSMRLVEQAAARRRTGVRGRAPS